MDKRRRERPIAIQDPPPISKERQLELARIRLANHQRGMISAYLEVERLRKELIK